MPKPSRLALALKAATEAKSALAQLMARLHEGRYGSARNLLEGLQAEPVDLDRAHLQHGYLMACEVVLGIEGTDRLSVSLGVILSAKVDERDGKGNPELLAAIKEQLAAVRSPVSGSVVDAVHHTGTVMAKAKAGEPSSTAEIAQGIADVHQQVTETESTGHVLSALTHGFPGRKLRWVQGPSSDGLPLLSLVAPLGDRTDRITFCAPNVVVNGQGFKLSSVLGRKFLAAAKELASKAGQEKAVEFLEGLK